MNSKEKNIYADLIMGMQARGMLESDSIEHTNNGSGRDLYGEKFDVIRRDFKRRVVEDLKKEESKVLSSSNSKYRP